MENPYESTQRNILSRIVNNMTRLNQSVMTMNQEMKLVNQKNQQLCTVATICDNYQESVQFNLSTTGQLKPAAKH
ncbi:DASH complex subunit Dad4p [Monosporozyma servazzii]